MIKEELIIDSCSFLSEAIGKQVKKDDNIFEVGVNSIIAIKLISFLWKKYKVKIDYTKLYSFNTVEEIINVIYNENIQIQNQELQEKSVKIIESSELCSSQKGIWMYELMNIDTKFILAAYTEFEGNISLNKLKSSIENVISNDCVFKIKFAKNKEGKAYQYLDKNENLNSEIEIIDFNSIEAAESKIEELCKKKIDIEKSMLYKIIIVTIKGVFKRVYYLIHHLIADEETFEILNNMVIAEYFSISKVNEKTSYLNYCYEKSQMDNTDDIKYWEKQLTEDKIDNYKLFEKNDKIRNYQFKISNEEMKKLNSFALQHNTTLYTAFLSLLVTSLYLLQGRKRIFISTAISDRINCNKYINCLGMFVNNQILDFEVTYRNKFLDLLLMTNEKVIGAKTHSGLAIDDMINQSERINKKYLDLQSNIVFNFIDFERNQRSINDVLIYPMEYIVKPENGLNIYVQHIEGKYICDLSSVSTDISNSTLEELSKIMSIILNKSMYTMDTEIINYI